MAIDVDGFAVLGAIAQSPQRFALIEADIDKAARSLLVKLLKAKGLALQPLRDVHDAVGAATFSLVLDGMSDAEMRSLVAKVDKHCPELKAMSAATLRRRTIELATGADAAQKSVRAAAPKRSPPPKGSPRVASVTSPAFSAIWDGKDHDAPAPKARKPRG